MVLSGSDVTIAGLANDERISVHDYIPYLSSASLDLCSASTYGTLLASRPVTYMSTEEPEWRGGTCRQSCAFSASTVTSHDGRHACANRLAHPRRQKKALFFIYFIEPFPNRAHSAIVNNAASTYMTAEYNREIYHENVTIFHTWVPSDI